MGSPVISLFRARCRTGTRRPSVRCVACPWALPHWASRHSTACDELKVHRVSVPHVLLS
uniref:Uncharacterized protein n=1 Tax=Setaria italica TaxID=4555 RepID=K3YP11_SETIT